MSDYSLVEVRIDVPDLDAAVEAWRTAVRLDAAVDVASRSARILVQGITIVLVEGSAEAPAALSGITLGAKDLDRLRDQLVDIIRESDDLALDPSATNGAPVRLVETPK